MLLKNFNLTVYFWQTNTRNKSLDGRIRTRGRCYDFKNIFPKIIGEKLATLVSKKNANFFRRKLVKIAEKLCDHIIDPWIFWSPGERYDC
jgi:hypothetical protein